MFAKTQAYARLVSQKICLNHPRTARVLGFAHAKRRPLLRIFMLVMHVIGFFQSINAVMETRTSQGAIAWAISLNTFPYIAVPAYAIFGDNDFKDYVTTRKVGLEEIRPMARSLVKAIKTDPDAVVTAPEKTSTGTLMDSLSKLSSLPLTSGNKAELLVDGKDSFHSIFKTIDSAEKYILIQFYIYRDDDIGRQLRDKLVRKAREGVKVYVIYDDYGSL